MMTCPNCGSSNITSNKIQESVIEKVAQAAQAARHVGHRGATFGAVAVWGGMQAVNAFRKDWKCSDCGLKF